MAVVTMVITGVIMAGMATLGDILRVGLGVGILGTDQVGMDTDMVTILMDMVTVLMDMDITLMDMATTVTLGDGTMVH